MVVELKITKLLESRTGTTRDGKPYCMTPAIAEWKETNQYGGSIIHKVTFELGTSTKIAKVKADMESGANFQAYIYHEVREYNGRCYNDIRVRLNPEYYEPKND